MDKRGMFTSKTAGMILLVVLLTILSMYSYENFRLFTGKAIIDADYDDCQIYKDSFISAIHQANILEQKAKAESDKNIARSYCQDSTQILTEALRYKNIYDEICKGKNIGELGYDFSRGCDWR